jgi:hypothetical protein
MKATEIDGKLSGGRLGINLDESLAKADVAPGIILLSLDGRWNNRVDSDNRCDE